MQRPESIKKLCLQDGPSYEAIMCGIAALFNYRSDAPPIDQSELKKINDRMRRRGPDGEGLAATTRFSKFPIWPMRR